MADHPSQVSVNQEEIAGKVKRVLSSLLEVDVEDIKESSRLEADLGADSLLYFELFEELKDEFNLDIDLHLLGKYASKHRVSTVGELADMIGAYLVQGDAMFAELQQKSAASAR